MTRAHVDPGAIRALRRGLAENTTTFGARVGVSGRTVEDWEQGRRRPSGPAALLLQRLSGDGSARSASESA
jgi:putative transcriptional regulator